MFRLLVICYALLLCLVEPSVFMRLVCPPLRLSEALRLLDSSTLFTALSSQGPHVYSRRPLSVCAVYVCISNVCAFVHAQGCVSKSLCMHACVQKCKDGKKHETMKQ